MFSKIIYNIEEVSFNEYLDELIDEGLIIQRGDKYYYFEMDEAEKNIAEYLKIRINKPDELFDEKEVERLLTNYEKTQGICYAAKQRENPKLFFKVFLHDFDRRTWNWENDNCSSTFKSVFGIVPR